MSMSAEGIKRNRSRSLLTTLGIIIGVGSVVLMVSIGNSFERYILNQVESFGGGLIEIYPKGLEEYGGSLDTITFNDVDALGTLSTVTQVAPVIFVPEAVQYGTERVTPFLAATNPNFYRNLNMTVSQGRGLSADDVSAARPVAVLGPDAAEELFAAENPLGKRVTIGSRKLTVIGVADELGSLSGQQMDGAVVIPLSVGRAMTGFNYATYVSVQAVDDVELALLDITSLLRQRHGIENSENDPDQDDFLARSTEQATAIIGTVTAGITAFLGLIAGISLVVGGIGIMNIMLVSVTERTKEIGLRKAVGARQSDVLIQFLLEAMMLTMLGGIIGIVGGLAIAYVLALIINNFLGDFPFAVSVSAIVLSTLMALGTGLVFGLYPARRASLLSPMEALRWE